MEQQIKKIIERNLIESMDKVSERGIRMVLYEIIRRYPHECQTVIDIIIRENNKPKNKNGG